jgi:hypothetical protein
MTDCTVDRTGIMMTESGRWLRVLVMNVGDDLSVSEEF